MNFNRDFEDRRVNTALGALHYKHHKGDGKSLVFLHGFGASVLSWKRAMELLPGDYNVYLIDLLGHGLSDAPEIDYTVKAQVEALWELFEQENLSGFYLIGHSYGGWIAAYYASKYAVGGLVLEDAPGLKEAFDQIVAANRVEEFKSTFFKLSMEFSGNKDYVMKSILDSDFREDQLTDEILAEITEPTLIIWGSRDIMLSPENAKIFKSKIKNSSIRIISGAGHTGHFTHPQEFIDYILGFVEKF
ncbi:MAG: alpha/beta hydrolase [Candidatus Micrarchaeales archaeon]|nr:alpha/beta hydrolase [Candidatus Micrarchaeales archaeon]